MIFSLLESIYKIIIIMIKLYLWSAFPSIITYQSLFLKFLSLNLQVRKPNEVEPLRGVRVAAWQ